MSVFDIIKINKVAILCALIVMALLVVYKFKTPSSTGVVLAIQEEGMSEESQRTLTNAIDASNRSELTRILDNNPELIVSLSNQIQSSQLNEEFSETSLKRLSSLAQILKKLLTSARTGFEHRQFGSFEKERPKLTNYLLAYTNLKRKQGNGVMSVHNAMTQYSLAQATHLLLELQAKQSTHQKLSKLARWYSIEKEAMPKIRIYQLALLHNAWEHNVENIAVTSLLKDFNIESHLSRDSDLIRLLSHENGTVSRNAAVLIGYFAPDNAITALRFQLARSDDELFRFSLLDALKSYGQYRSQFEPQLKKMLRMTQDSALQHKIMETLDHVYGRSNELLSQSDQTQ